MSRYKLETLFPDQIEQRLKERPILVLPFGTIEWHSYHLPLGLDGLAAESLCERIASQLEAVCAPVSYWAVGGVPYPYTLNLTGALIEPLLVALFEQFGAMGFQVIVAFTGHFGLEQTLVLKRAAVEVMQRSPVTILPVTEYDLVTDIGYLGDHAAVGETSILQALYPELVRLDAIPAEQALDGILGKDPREAPDMVKGNEVIDAIRERTAEVANRLLAHTTALQRAEFLQALESGVRVLEKIQQQRQVLPKAQIPPVATPAYLGYCQAIYRGDYRLAKAHAERKLQDLEE